MQQDIDPYPYEAAISYKSNWNEASAWAIEQYGLPGSNFLVNHRVDGMLFRFKKEEDCVWFALKWS